MRCEVKRPPLLVLLRHALMPISSCGAIVLCGVQQAMKLTWSVRHRIADKALAAVLTRGAAATARRAPSERALLLCDCVVSSLVDVSNQRCLVSFVFEGCRL